MFHVEQKKLAKGEKNTIKKQEKGIIKKFRPKERNLVLKSSIKISKRECSI